MSDHLLQIAFYALAALQGVNGWLVMIVALDDNLEPLVQGRYTVPMVAPVRRLMLHGMAWSLMLACALAWIAPAWTVALSWVGAAFAAMGMLLPAVLEYGWRGPAMLPLAVWLTVAVRAAACLILTWQAPRMSV